MLHNLLINAPDFLFRGLFYVDDTLLVLAGLLIGLGLAGRHLGWGPHCRACGFDLRGVSEQTASCPECGAALHAPRAVTYGVRSPRWGMLITGGILLGVGGLSTWMQWPATVWYWRAQVIANAFNIEELLELTLQGNSRAATELQQALAGHPRPNSSQVPPGVEVLNLLLDRMEEDPPSRTILMPMLLGSNRNLGTFLRTRESMQPVRIARLLNELVQQDPALLSTLSPNAMASVFQGANRLATIELLSSPDMVRHLYRGSTTPEPQVSDTTGQLMLRIGPTFGGLPGAVWLMDFPLALDLTGGEWRLQGEPDDAWRPVAEVRRVPMSPDGEVRLTNLPPEGVVEVRVRGTVVQGPQAEALRRDFIPPQLRQRVANALPPNPHSPAANAADTPDVVPFEWNGVLALKSRDRLTLTPIPSRGLPPAIENHLRTAWLSRGSRTIPDTYLVNVGPLTDRNGTVIPPRWTLEQDGRLWHATQDPQMRGGPEHRITAPGFDPDKPFMLHVVTDLETLRRNATGDLTYFDLRATLHCEGVDRMPHNVTELQNPAVTPGKAD